MVWFSLWFKGWAFYQFAKNSFLVTNIRNQELQHLSKERSLSKNLSSALISTTEYYILTKPKTSYKPFCRNCYTFKKKSYLHWRGIATYLYPLLTKLLLILHNMNCPRKNLIYLRQVYTFQFKQIKFKNTKYSLSLKGFIVQFLTTLNPRKPKVR